MVSKIEKLRKELAELEAKEKEKQEIKKLEKEIKARKFAQTKGGKVFNAIGKFGEKITRPQPKPKDQGKKAGFSKKKPLTVDEVIARLPQ